MAKLPIMAFDSPGPISRDGPTPHLWRRHVLALVFFLALFCAFFAPAMLSRHLLAPGDGLLYYLPHYEMPSALWNPDLMTGFPEMADPQLMNWYAPARILSVIPGSWNAFVLCAYVLASWFTYLYLSRLTQDGFAALIGGIVYGLSGFMVAHLGHTTIIHAAAWIPAMLLAAEEFNRGGRLRWILFGGFSVSQCILAGHPQIALYGLALTGACIFWGLLDAGPGRKMRLAGGLGMILLGLILSAAQIITTGVFADATSRARMSFAQFSEYSISPYQLVLLAFPCLFGGAGATALDGIPYFGAGSLTEVSGYVGLSSVVLASIGVLSLWRNRKVLFWMAAAVISLLAAMGPATPLGGIVYMLPGFGQFRAQARFIGVFCLSASILAGYGVSAMRRRLKRTSDVVVILGALLALLAVGVFIVPAFAPQMRAAAATQGFASLAVSLSGNRWLRLPLIGGFGLTAILLLFRWRPNSRSLQAILAAGMICELSLFGWFAEWRFASPAASQLQPPPFVGSLAAFLRQNGGRWLSVHGYQSTEEAPSDLAALWGLPAIAKYGPLLPTRFGQLLEIETNGRLLGDWWDARDRALDIVGARLFAIKYVPPPSTASFEGIPFPAEEINLIAGKGCGAQVAKQRIFFRHAKPASEVGIVSLMGCSTNIEQGSPVLAMQLYGSGGASQRVVLRAGLDTAEWAAGCTDVAPVMHHKPANIFSRFPVPRGGQTCEGQKYATILKLPRGPMQVQSVDLEWLPPGDGVMRILGLVFSEGPKRVEPFEPMDTWLGDPSRWREFHREGGIEVFENLRALPRSWIVPETLSLSADDIKKAIQTSLLPDGRQYDPHAVALIEEPLGLHSPPDPEGHAWILEDKKTALDIQTINRQPAFLVLGDFYFPGWRALVNGQPSRIFQTNYIQRGVLLPAGQNRVRFEFRPGSLYAGCGVSGAGVILSVLAAWLARKRGWL